jgi:hypothetical protein
VKVLQQQMARDIPTSNVTSVGSDSSTQQYKRAVMEATSDETTIDNCSTSSNEEEPEQSYGNHEELGSFAASTCPIDFIDDNGNLPLTKISSLLPVVEEEEEEEVDNFFSDMPEKQLSRGEEETLDTLSTHESESTRPTDVLRSSMILEQESNLVFIDHERSSYKQEEQMKAMCIMKDVIFKQRSTIKRVVNEKCHVRSKYDRCKTEKRNLQNEHKVVRNKMTKLTRKTQEMEDEIEMLRAKLDLARMELRRRRPVAGIRKALTEGKC